MHDSLRFDGWILLAVVVVLTMAGCGRDTKPSVSESSSVADAGSAKLADSEGIAEVGETDHESSDQNLETLPIESPSMDVVADQVEGGGKQESSAPAVDESTSEGSPVQDSEVSANKVAADSSANEMPELDPPPMRIYVPTNAGPLLLAVDIRIDEVPLVTAFEKRVRKVMAEADTDGKSGVSWDELVDHLESDQATFGNVAQNIGNRKNLVQLQDQNRNSRADYDEVVRMLFRNSGFSYPFRVEGTDFYRGRQSSSKLFAALDSNEDRSLNASEIEMATDAILLLDRNGDRRLALAEIVDPDERDNMAWNRRRIRRDGTVAMDIDGYVDWQVASYQFTDFPKARPFQLPDHPLENLDQNQDGYLATDEAKSLRQAKPDLILRADFSSKKSQSKLTMLWVRNELADKVAFSASTSQIALGDQTLRLWAHLKDQTGGRAPLPREAFAMLDANNDGGLDAAEIPDQFEDQYSFEDFDADGDGLLTYEEIEEGMAPKSPVWKVQVRGRAAEFSDALFAFLDEDGDFSLSERELIAAPQRLKACAVNGALNAQSVPETILVQIVRGDPMRREQLFVFESSSLENAAEVPAWVRGMDVNGDGEISDSEFIGTPAQFKRLDADQDGFIEPSEVETPVEDPETEKDVARVDD